MRKLVWAAAIVLGILLVTGLVLSFAVRSYLSSERLKAVLIPRLEEFTGRQVAVEDIDVSLFKGIVVKGISIKQRDGKGDFARTEQFILNYSLMPLLRRQLVIEKVEVVGPYVSIRREKDGSYNFSDIVERRAAEGKKQGAGAQEGMQELPLSIVTNRITLKDARLEFVDAQKALPQVTAHVSEGRLTAAVGRTLSDIDLTGSFDIKSITAVMGALTTATAGTVEIKNNGVVLALTTKIGDDTVKTTGTISGSLAAPSARIDIAAKELDLEKLLALTGSTGQSGSRAGGAGSALAFDAAGSRKDGQRTAPIVLVAASPAQGKGDLMRALTAAGTVKVDTGRYGDYRIRDFSLKYRFEKGVMRLEPVTLGLSGGAQVAVEGSAAASALFRAAGEGDVAALVKETLSAKGTADFSSIAIKQSKITDTVALLTGVEALRNPRFNRSQFTFSAGGQKIFLNGTMDSPQVKVVPSGTVGFDKRLDLVVDLRLAPELTARLGRSAKLAGLLKDSEGWSTVPLKITGTTEKPSVSINPVSVQRQLQQSLQGELQRRLQKELAPPQQEQGAAPGQRAPSKGGRPEDLLRDLFGR